MSFIKVENGTNLFYKDWGTGKPVVFVHGWCINCDSWEYIVHNIIENGFRCVAYDQRGCGRSDQPWDGYDYGTLADDLSALIEHLDLKDVVLVGHSMGCGVITKYLADHGDVRITKAVLLGTTTPYILKTAENPDGIDVTHLNDAINFMKADRPAYVRSLADGFFDLQNPVNPLSGDLVEWAVGITLQASSRASVEMLNTSITSDLRKEMAKIKVPVLFLHGDKDVSCPTAITAAHSRDLVVNGRLKIYENMAHGAYIDKAKMLSADILEFINRGKCIY